MRHTNPTGLDARDLLAAIVDSSNDGIVSKTLDGRITSWNRSAERIFGYSATEAIGRNIAMLFPPERRSEEDELIAAITSGRRVEHYETERLRKDGTLVPVSVTLSPIRDAAGEIVGVSKIVRDITDVTARRRAETALQESRDALAFAMRGGRMGAWSRNLTTNEVWWSPEFKEIVGRPEPSAGGLLALIHPDDRPRVEAAVEHAIRTRGDYRAEFRYHHPSGGWRWMDGRGRATYAPDGRAISINGISVDITERKQAESELAAARDAAEAANRAKDEFMAMLGHELRNPLSPILTALQLMKLRGGAELSRERTVIERQVTHLTRLVDDLLDVSRITRGTVALKTRVIEIGRAVAQAVEMASPLLEERAHVLELDVPAEGLAVEADPDRMAQVLSNLLTNAAKYTPPGGRVRVTAAREGDEVVVRVRDTGIGINPDVLPYIFQVFVQGPRALDRGIGGLGLGLTIVRNLVEAHGGVVEAISAGSDRGSEFVVKLPVAQPGAGSAQEPAAVTPRAAVHGTPRRVLVVDDNADAAEMLAAALIFRGLDVRVAHDGPQALDAARVFRPDAAVLDIGLPIMDGYELAERLRQLPGLDRVTLVAVTGYGQQSDRQRSSAAGFNHHLVKPVDLEALSRLLAEE